MTFVLLTLLLLSMRCLTHTVELWGRKTFIVFFFVKSNQWNQRCFMGNFSDEGLCLLFCCPLCRISKNRLKVQCLNVGVHSWTKWNIWSHVTISYWHLSILENKWNPVEGSHIGPITFCFYRCPERTNWSTLEGLGYLWSKLILFHISPSDLLPLGLSLQGYHSSSHTLKATADDHRQCKNICFK